MADEINSNLGVSRRQLIKRGAIVGGTLMWAAPVVQSLTSPAGAQGAVGTPNSACCFCYNGNNAANAADSECTANGLNGPRANATNCEAFCDAGGLDHPGNDYDNFQYDRGLVGCLCNSNPALGATGCNCA